MPIQALIFDMGGVFLQMVDGMPRLQIAERLGLPLDTIYAAIFDSESALRAMRGEFSYEHHWACVCAELGLAADDCADLHNEFWRADGIDRQLTACIRHLRPHYKIGLLSNAWDDLRRKLVRWGLTDLFDDVVNSAEVGLVKPDLQIYTLALARLGVAPAEAVFVDDRQENVEAARQVGMWAVQFTDRALALAELAAILAQDGWASQPPSCIKHALGS